MKPYNLFYISILMLTGLIFTGCLPENQKVLDRFLAGGTKVVVCPVHLLDRESSSFDRTLAESIVDYINEKELAEAEVIDLYPPPNGQWRADQEGMLNESLGLFIEFVKYQDFPKDTFIFYCEFLRGGKSSKVVGIHYYLVDSIGRIAMKGLLNSHMEEFAKEEPETNEDCLDVLINGFEDKILK